MTKSPGLRRILIAFVVSAVLNGILLVLYSFTDPRQYPPSMLSKIVGVLFSPAGAFGDWFAPVGHGAAHFVVGFGAAVASSILFYAVWAWVALSLPVWWYKRE